MERSLFGRLKRPTLPADPDTATPLTGAVATAGQIARLLGQLHVVDELTSAALYAGHDTDLAIDIRRKLGLKMPVPTVHPADTLPRRRS